jgi:parvulin-like peptidyl-prolyl isomerase
MFFRRAKHTEDEDDVRTGRAGRRPARGRRRPAFRDDEARQTLVVSIVFIGIVVIAAVILVGAVAIGYYNDHLVAVGKVNGVSINKDEWNARVKFLDFQITQAEGQINSAVAAGTLDQTTAQSEIQSYEQQRQTEGSDALESLINQIYMNQLGSSMGISISTAEIDAAYKAAGESPETRHVLDITVTPQLSAGAELPTTAQIDAAKTKADQALAALKAGGDFATVAKQYSDDPSKDSGAVYGDVTADYPADPAWIKAIFSTPVNGITGIIQGADGVYRIGKVTKITPPVPDPAFADQVKTNVGLDAFRNALEGQLIQKQLSAKIVADDLKQPVEQVHAYQILIQTPASGSVTAQVGGEVKVSHILFSPNHDPQGATTLATSDPAWAAAKKLADAAAAQLRAITDISQRETTFASMAKSQSDDSGSASQGGELGWASYSDYVTPFAQAIFEGNHTAGEIIGPVQTQYGYHVILWEAKRPDPQTWITQLLQQAKAPGADFQAIAKANSDGTDASQGGDMGWIAPGQESDPKVEKAVFALQAGELSASPVLLSDGYHIYKVTDRTSRALSAAQVGEIETNAFGNWFLTKKDALQAAGKIYRDPTIAPGSSTTG